MIMRAQRHVIWEQYTGDRLPNELIQSMEKAVKVTIRARMALEIRN